MNSLYIKKLNAKVSLLALIAAFSLVIISTTPVFASAGINKQINFQGKVTNSTGTNVANGSYTFVFGLYTASSGGSPVWTETKSLTVTDGVFQTNLGDTTTLPGSIDFNTDNIYLGVEFNSDGEMSPRIQFTAAPYAFNALKVSGLTVTNTTGTFTLTNAKTLTVSDSTTLASNSITFGGTESLSLAASKNVTFADAFTTSGANALTLTTIGSTNVTLPTTGTLATLAGSESLSNKTLVSPTITTSPTAAGATWTDLGTVTTADINGGTIDGTVIGGSSAAAGTFTNLIASSSVLVGGTTSGNSDIILNDGGSAVFNEQGAAVDFRVESDNISNMFVVDGTNDKIGVGAAPITATKKLYVQGTMTSAASSYDNIAQINSFLTSVTNSNGVVGLSSIMSPSQTTNAIGELRAFDAQNYFNNVMAGGAATIIAGQAESMFAANGLAGASPVGTITTLSGLQVGAITNAATGTPNVTVTSNLGVRIANMGTGSGTNGLTITSAAGLAIANQTTATNNTNLLIGTVTIPTGTVNYSIYNSSTYGNYLAGNTGIGATPSSNFALYATATTTSSSAQQSGVTLSSQNLTSVTNGNIYYNLEASGNSSHTTSSFQERNVASEYTFGSNMGAQATVGISNVYNYYALPGLTTGANGTVSNWYGYYAEAPFSASTFTATVTAKTGFYGANQGTLTGGGSGLTVTSAAGMVLANTTGATNNTNLVIGQTSIPTGTYSIFNASSNANYFAGNVGIGTSTPNALLDVLSTSTQLRVSYDASNYYTTAVSSAGAVTFDATGASAGFTFSDALTGSSTITSTSTLTASSGFTVTTGTVNITTNAASTYAVPANTSAAFRITNGSNSYYAIDTRNSTSGVIANSFITGAAPSITSASGSFFNSASFTPGTVTLTGTTQVTGTGVSANNAILFNQPTLAGNGTRTVDQAANVYINSAVIASSSSGTGTITDSAALRIGAGSTLAGTGGAVTRAFGLYVDAPTGGTANYAATFATGNVGIGTTAPSTAKLVVSGGSVRANGLIADNGSGQNIAIYDGTDFRFGPTGNLGSNIIMSINGEKMRITNSTGNVSIGTGANANYKLEVNGQTAATSLMATSSLGSATANAAALSIESGAGRLISFGANSSTKGTMNFVLSTSTGGTQLNAMSIATTGDTTITGSGGSCTLTGGITGGAATCTSDIRLKENIVTVGSDLDRLMQLRPVTYNWKDQNLDQSIQTGLIAQEVQPIFPEFVREMNNGYLGVNYQGFIVPVIRSIQEVNTKVENMKDSGIALKLDSSGNLILPNKAKNIVGELDIDGGNFTIKDSAGETRFTVDQSGNASFAGTLTVGRLIAGQIDGLAVISDKISNLEFRIQTQEDKESSNSSALASLQAELAKQQLATPAALLTDSPEATDAGAVTYSSLFVAGVATVSGDLTADNLHIRNSTIIESILNVADTITSARLIVTDLAEFMKDVVFKGNVEFAGTPTFNQDTAGVVTVHKGDKEAEITFEREYTDSPVVTGTLSVDQLQKNDGESDSDFEDRQKQLEEKILNGEYKYIIARRTNKGFVIKLNKPAEDDLQFNWTALSVKKQQFASN